MPGEAGFFAVGSGKGLPAEVGKLIDGSCHRFCPADASQYPGWFDRRAGAVGNNPGRRALLRATAGTPGRAEGQTLVKHIVQSPPGALWS
ncbi:hypothetical protein [Streptomyces enissocaesilis]|uniref:Uncharacterized protein n=1 Tax=Streptomyces enissocaesilis TaxID=332589 RepID=A0ABN3X6R4_9ACTN